MLKAGLIVWRDALIAALILSLIAIGVNAVREGGIPLVATEEYEIYVPCPEPLGEAFPIEPSDARVTDERTLLIDGRSEQEYEDWHAPGARHVQFDYLTPIPADLVQELVRTGAAMVVVYGDGDPEWDSGYELGRELSGRGLKNVHYVTGGAPALREQSR